MDLLQYLQKTLGEAEGKTTFDKINADSEFTILVDSKKQSNYVKKEKFDQIDSERKDYKKQLSDRDKQLEDLKVKAQGNETLTAEIEKLKADNAKISSDYEAKINQINFDSKFEKALSDYKPKNSKALKALLDMEKVKLDGDTFLGLEEQLKALKESDAYLFEPEVTGGTGKVGASSTIISSNKDKTVDEVKTIGGLLAKQKAESMSTTESSFFK
ncbi:phage scaffolding protein [Clostridium sp. DJ247]|uniref:phage scaffolding protein n=1 Tax=Clostridium sp. DJ247 TaxID=2726188 RepID=UPI00162720BD|nr:phage scaffolding protein [Clostridium sp. DJ247]MBC2579986.1 phage scaffold protein [Clostridium sp. DJ247]